MCVCVCVCVHMCVCVCLYVCVTHSRGMRLRWSAHSVLGWKEAHPKQPALSQTKKGNKIHTQNTKINTNTDAGLSCVQRKKIIFMHKMNALFKHCDKSLDLTKIQSIFSTKHNLIPMKCFSRSTFQP